MKNFRLILTLFSFFIMGGMRAQSTVESADSISGTDSLKNEKELS